MNYRLIQKKNELLEKYPSEAGKNLYDFNLSQFNRSAPPTYGIVVDNKDPDCLGRLKLMLPLVGPNAVTAWCQVVGNKKTKAGFWALPDIGTQVIVCFPYGNYSRGIVLGCIYDEKHRPPKHDTENPAKSYLLQTKKHRIEIIDEDGKEEIRMESAQGKMRAILSSKGVELINELDGGIEVKCKTLSVKGKNINFNCQKDFSMSTEDSLTLKESGKLSITSDKFDKNVINHYSTRRGQLPFGIDSRFFCCAGFGWFSAARKGLHF